MQATTEATKRVSVNKVDIFRNVKLGTAMATCQTSDGDIDTRSFKVYKSWSWRRIVDEAIRSLNIDGGIGSDPPRIYRGMPVYVPGAFLTYAGEVVR